MLFRHTAGERIYRLRIIDVEGYRMHAIAAGDRLLQGLAAPPRDDDRIAEC